MKSKNKGITLIALVVTIILLLILAGITIVQLTGNGLFDKVQLAKKQYENAEQKENAILGDYENLIGDTIDNTRDTVTLSKEEYESLKPNSITEGSVLMESENKNLSVGTLYLNSFSNKFSENFETYFTYDETTGDLTCKKDGWYFTQLYTIVSTNSNWTSINLRLYINDVFFTQSFSLADAGGVHDRDVNSFSIFLKQGDVVKFNKGTSNANATDENIAGVRIIKL